ncbi:xanthine dehydrogenase family protein molybdopterin-binding subunit [Paraburkholderia hospita]|uniref:xanthine dehydrogenase family protein molybdopterin-binding subunit n=1 Tax=Paraburkholderia hospita TaxID=169430 RepID=UPI000271589D|nr:xanthine dehydrogenase family protein molybdopterin-binding subunit [Paraburkholderia hospita]EUC20990.1 Xanthine dehydrogenase [Burkholderia sp. BT03]SKC57048.1 xanthine dehydrogenase, molybdenum binding subunit apoprotein [Paraburkholderia hospita]SKD06128.1 xanthine dehydrogenase, molybdenum binding subunit apoprotein [Paraburkholderia hospita]
MSEQIIGQALRRVDGRLKVTGAARYTADQSLPGMVYAYGVFSTVASGRVLRIDTTDARRVPGVIDIFHHEHFPRLYRAPKSPISAATILTSSITDESRLPFEDATVNYAGQFVALVVADTFEHAREAAFRVNVQYATNRAVANLDQGLATGGTRDGGRGHARGEPEPAFGSAPHRIDAVYRTPVETHNPMEMHATVARWDGDELRVYEASQGVTVHRNTLARVFGLTPDRVTVQAPFIGSGFGSKLFMWPHSVAASAAAREVGRPVKLVVPRAQMFTATGHRPETRQRLRLSADASGRLTSLRHESINTTSFTDQFTENCGGVSRSLYSCPNVLVSHRTTQVNRGSSTSMRAPGAAPGLFALESAIDELAEQVGMDPLAFRLLNLSTRDEAANLPWSSNHLREAIEQGGKRFGWAQRDPRIGAMRDGHEVIGYGMAACNWDAYRTPAEARVQLRSDGTASVTCAIQDIGTGTYTIAAQVVGALTGLPVERIEVKLGDSSFPAAPVSGGSWATASVMPAIAEATRNAIAQLKTFATSGNAYFAGAKPEDIRFENGRLVSGERSVDFSAVLKGQRLANAEGYAHTPGAPTGQFSFRSFGVHFVEVRWDPGISHLRVARVVSAIDVGRVVNPLTARNQVEGAIVMGIGMALFEATEYDPRTGMPANNNYAEYPVPVHADQPDIDVILLDYPDLALNEFGARGIGEIGITGLAAAVANAVRHATGKRIRDLPITLDKLIDDAHPLQS